MSANRKRSDPDDLAVPPYAVRRTFDRTSPDADSALVAVRRCQDLLQDRFGTALGESHVSINSTTVALRWRSGGFIECVRRDAQCRWLIVDPSGVEAPAHDAGDTDALRQGVVSIVDRWAVPAKQAVSYEEYLAIEQRTPLRVEFLDGYIYAMAGGTLRHAAVSSAAVILLGAQLRGRCHVFGSDAKLWVPKFKSARYPDAMVVCGEIQVSDRDSNALVNPLLIVEVISPGTEEVDRTEKLEEYKSIPTLRHYLLVDSEQRSVEVYSKRTRWLKRPLLFGPEDTVTLTEPDFTLVVRELYAGSGVPEPTRE